MSFRPETNPKTDSLHEYVKGQAVGPRRVRNRHYLQRKGKDAGRSGTTLAVASRFHASSYHVGCSFLCRGGSCARSCHGTGPPTHWPLVLALQACIRGTEIAFMLAVRYGLHSLHPQPVLRPQLQLQLPLFLHSSKSRSLSCGSHKISRTMPKPRVKGSFEPKVRVPRVPAVWP
jgi:hypothetical protein